MTTQPDEQPPTHTDNSPAEFIDRPDNLPGDETKPVTGSPSSDADNDADR
jgi:hypothetical protein